MTCIHVWADKSFFLMFFTYTYKVSLDGNNETFIFQATCFIKQKQYFP